MGPEMKITIELTHDLDKPRTALLIAAGFVLIGLIGAFDYFTGGEIAFSIFYLIPISLIAWFTSRTMGLFMSIISAIIWLVVDLNTSTYSHPFIPYWNATVRLGFFLIVTLLLLTLKTTLKHEEKLAKTDSLTGVANARAFAELASLEIDRARRYRHPFAAAYIDLDNFKPVNDVFGHTTGDTVLQTVAGTLQANLRAVDLVGRLGGDEFGILLPETRPKQAAVAAHKVQKILLDAMQANNWPVTFSIGVVTFLRPPRSVDEMIQEADNLMYSAKKSGKNVIKEKTYGK